MESIKKIDIHIHVTAFPEWIPHNLRTKQKFLSAEKLFAFYDKWNLEKGEE